MCPCRSPLCCLMGAWRTWLPSLFCVLAPWVTLCLVVSPVLCHLCCIWSTYTLWWCPSAGDRVQGIVLTRKSFDSKLHGQPQGWPYCHCAEREVTSVKEGQPSDPTSQWAPVLWTAFLSKDQPGYLARMPAWGQESSVIFELPPPSWENYNHFVVEMAWLKSNVIISGNTWNLPGVLQTQITNHGKYINTLKIVPST